MTERGPSKKALAWPYWDGYVSVNRLQPPGDAALISLRVLAAFGAVFAIAAQASAAMLAVRSDGGAHFALLDRPSAEAVLALDARRDALPPLGVALLLETDAGEVVADLPAQEGSPALGLLLWHHGAGPVFSEVVQPLFVGHGGFASAIFQQDEAFGAPFAIFALPAGATRVLVGADASGHEGFVLGGLPHAPRGVPAPAAAGLLGAGLLGLAAVLAQRPRRRASRAGAAATRAGSPQ